MISRAYKRLIDGLISLDTVMLHYPIKRQSNPKKKVQNQTKMRRSSPSELPKSNSSDRDITLHGFIKRKMISVPY